MIRKLKIATCFALPIISVWCATAFAQELAPRAYWPAPEGTNLLVVSYQLSSGDVVTDPALPITGVESTTNFAQITYQRTLSTFGRSANLQFNLPYTWGSTEGFAEGEFRSRNISAFSDARMRLSINLRGAPTMDMAAFQALRAKPRTIVGVSVLVQAPTGGYEPDKLINASSNRWSIKPAIGVIWPMRPTWLLEFEFDAWFFGDNDEFLGTTRQQDPILSGEFHLVKRIRPGFWASLDATYYFGGHTAIGEVLRNDKQRNSRLGATVLFPFKRRHAIRISLSTGLTTTAGGDFENFSLSYAYVWL